MQATETWRECLEPKTQEVNLVNSKMHTIYHCLKIKPFALEGIGLHSLAWFATGKHTKPWRKSFEFFLNNTIWHFWQFCTKLTSRGFKISKNKVASTGNWSHNTNHLWITILTALRNHSANLSVCTSLRLFDPYKSSSIEPEMSQVQFKDFLFN